MPAKKRVRSVYPLAVSISMIIASLVLSFVDLTFLNDVIGKVLDLDSVSSMFIAFALGLIGIALMAHQGIKEAHGENRVRGLIVHYALWVGLGLAFVLVRLFSASILQLGTDFGDENLITLFAFTVREVDLVLAPLMLFLYLATGIMAKDGFKNLFLNPDFDVWLKTQQETRAAKKAEQQKRAREAESRITHSQEEALRLREKRARDIDEQRLANARTGSYSNALAQYREKEKEIKEKYQKISSNISFIRSIDKQERDFELKVKPGLLNIVMESTHSTQNNVALAIRKKTGADVATIRKVIDQHNTGRHENHRQNI